jgi:hypothetical protein
MITTIDNPSIKDAVKTPNSTRVDISHREQQRAKAQAAVLAAEEYTKAGSEIGCKNGARVNIRYRFKDESGPYVIALARELCAVHHCRWFSYCLLRYHPAAYQNLDDSLVDLVGQGIDNKAIADSYARILAGPAWLHGLVTDDLIQRWAHAEDRWRRRIALVSTIALNVRSADGGTGDMPRTLEVCRMLADDGDDIVYTALAWALRALVVHDPPAVRAFMAEYQDHLASRVHRDIAAALKRGHKKPSYSNSR